jgi:hypothetical protein
MRSIGLGIPSWRYALMHTLCALALPVLALRVPAARALAVPARAGRLRAGRAVCLCSIRLIHRGLELETTFQFEVLSLAGTGTGCSPKMLWRLRSGGAFAGARISRHG